MLTQHRGVDAHLTPTTDWENWPTGIVFYATLRLAHDVAADAQAAVDAAVVAVVVFLPVFSLD